MSYFTIHAFSKSQKEFHKVSEFPDLVYVISEKFVGFNLLSHVMVLLTLRVGYLPGRLEILLSEGCSFFMCIWPGG